MARDKDRDLGAPAAASPAGLYSFRDNSVAIAHGSDD